MAITEKQQRFIEEIAKNVQKYAYVYGILVHSPIIAQAILESGWGESKLAAKYHNYFRTEMQDPNGPARASTSPPRRNTSQEP